MQNSDVLAKFLLPSPFPVFLPRTLDDINQMEPEQLGELLENTFIAVPGMLPALGVGEYYLPHHARVLNALEWFYWNRQRAEIFIAWHFSQDVQKYEEFKADSCPLAALTTPDALKEPESYEKLYTAFFFVSPASPPF